MPRDPEQRPEFRQCGRMWMNQQESWDPSGRQAGGLGAHRSLVQKGSVPGFRGPHPSSRPWEASTACSNPRSPPVNLFIHGPCCLLEISQLETVKTSYLALSKFLKK